MPFILRASLALLILFKPLAASSQEGSIAIDSNVDRSTIRIGDLVTYTILVSRSPDVQVEMPGLAANLGSFEIRDYQIFDSQIADGQVVDKFEYTISTFDVGEFEIPPLEFYYTVPPDTTKHLLKTRKIKILVESIVPSEAGDIRDVKSPLELARDLRQIFIWTSVGLAVILLGLGAFCVWRRKRAGRGLLPERVGPPRPAHEVALEHLKELERSSLLTDGRVKEYYIEISEIIRRYIEGRYFIVALELTTFDVLEKLRSANIERDTVSMIQDFLEACDLAKFAKYVPTQEENAAAMSSAVEIVKKTMLVYEQQAERGESVRDLRSEEADDEIAAADQTPKAKSSDALVERQN